MANTVASRKAKGRRFQDYIGKRFADVTGLEFGNDKDIQGREMGQSGEDIRRLTTEAKRLIPFNIENKNAEKWSIPSWIKQAKQNQKDGEDWLLFVKKNHHEPIVVMDIEVFFRLVDKALRYDHPELDGDKNG